MTQRVGLVLVSHSAKIAQGLRELAGQMAGDVEIIAAGGLDDGSIGTSYDLIEAGVTKLRDKNLSALLLTDLGSATMTVEALIDALDDDEVRLVNAPFVEGAIAAAVSAQQGHDLTSAIRAAIGVGQTFAEDADGVPVAGRGVVEESTGQYSREATVADEAGLHARPAAQVAAMAGQFDGEVLINGEPADSIMAIMALGIKQGETVVVSTKDSDGHGIVDKIAEAISAGLD